MSSNTANVHLDDDLFRDDSDDDKDNDIEGDCPPQEPTLHSQEADSAQEPQKPVVGKDPNDCGFPTGASLKAMEITAQARIAVDEAREEMLVRAAIHVKSARVQRLLYRYYVAKAREHAQQKLPHHLRSYTFVVDYGQNMELPVFNDNQPGCTYYYSPLGVYNLGVVNHAHDYGSGEIKEHMYAHVYHEGDGKKGANNVASLIMKTLLKIGILRENEMGGELSIVFDNCSGQNKNNTILKMLCYLVEMGYFKQVNFIFLIVGHTKKCC